MAHVADHLSFETLTDVEQAVTERCRILNGDQLRPGKTSIGGPSQLPRPDQPEIV